MNIAGIVLLGIIILLLIVLVRKIDIIDKKAVKYVRVIRHRSLGQETELKFEKLGYEVSAYRLLGKDHIEFIFVKVGKKNGK